MIDFHKIIAKVFLSVLNAVLSSKYTHYWLKGGRGSTKSSFISLVIIILLLLDPNAHFVCLRKVKDTLRDSVFNQILWAIEKLNLNDYFTATLSPLCITYNKTGQKIYFRGCDDPMKIKSIKPQFGYIKGIWFEELAEYSGMEEIRTVNQSLIRGGDDFIVFYSYNPPKDSSSWVNQEAKENNSNRLIHHSTYLDVPAEWLGKQFIEEADLLKKNKPKVYEHEYLGIPNGENDFSVVKGWSDENERHINYMPDLDLHLSCDFNLSPNCWILAHTTADKAFFFKEYCMDLSTEELIKVVLDDYPHEGKIIINGDASGNFGHSNSNLTDYKLIKRELLRRGYKDSGEDGKRFSIELRKANGDRIKRFNAFNSRVKGDNGQVYIYADPKGCPYFIDNCRNLKIIPGTSKFELPSQTQMRKDPILRFRGHAYDNGSYLINTYWPI